MLAHRLQPGEAGDLVQVDAFELVGFGQRDGFVRCAWGEPGEFVDADLLRQHQGRKLLLQIARLAEVEQAEQQRRIFRLPVLGLVAALGQVRRQVVAITEQVGVDASGIHFKEAFEARR